ncbi:MAG: response regulator [Halanaeroarchaeum sp.]
MNAISVLHVDDDRAIADLTAASLERVDHRIEVQTAETAAEGLAVLGEDRIDCVVSDYDMPEMNGPAFLGAVREDHPELSFIPFTSKGSEEIASEAISAGVTDYLHNHPAATETNLWSIESRMPFPTTWRSPASEHARIIDEVPKTITAVIAADDPTGVFEAACCSIAAADPYCVAIAIDPAEEGASLEPTCWASEDRGFLDVVREVGVSLDVVQEVGVSLEDGPRGRGLGGRGEDRRDPDRTDPADDSAFEPWRDHAKSWGFESLAAVPLQ